MVRKTVIAASLLALAACTATPTATPSGTLSPSPSVEPTDTPPPDPTPTARELELKGLRILYDRSEPSRGSYRWTTHVAEVPSLEAQQVNTDLTDGTIYSSPNGAVLIKVSRKDDGRWQMRIGSGSGRLRFSNIYTTAHRITSVLITPDGAPIYFFTVEAFAEFDTDAAPRETLWRTYADGARVDRIARFTARPGEYLYRTLHAVDLATGGVIWSRETREGAGGHRDLSITDTETGETRRVGLSGLDNRVFPGQLEVTDDGSRFFHVREDNVIVETTVETGDERVLFEGTGDAQLYVTNLVASHDGKRLAFATGGSVYWGGPSAEGVKHAVHLMRLKDASTQEVYRSSAERAAEPFSWAPGDRYLYLWVGSSRHPHRILDRRTEGTIEMPLHAFLVSWLGTWDS